MQCTHTHTHTISLYKPETSLYLHKLASFHSIKYNIGTSNFYYVGTPLNYIAFIKTGFIQ